MKYKVYHISWFTYIRIVGSGEEWLSIVYLALSKYPDKIIKSAAMTLPYMGNYQYAGECFLEK